MKTDDVFAKLGRVRFQGLRVDIPHQCVTASDLRGVWYLIECERVEGPSKGAHWYTLSRTPGLTNISRQPLERGWLGCSYGLDQWALGTVTVRVDRLGRVRVVGNPD